MALGAYRPGHETPAHEILALLESVRPAWAKDSACREHPELPWVRPPRRNVDGAAALVAMRTVCGTCLVYGECRAASQSAATGTIIGVWAGRLFAPNTSGTDVVVTELDGIVDPRIVCSCGQPVARAALCWRCYNRRRRSRQAS